MFIGETENNKVIMAIKEIEFNDEKNFDDLIKEKNNLIMLNNKWIFQQCLIIFMIQNIYIWQRSYKTIFKRINTNI